jgi:7-cyano-7-deazaguanine synthase in queuosine biosynthesis
VRAELNAAPLEAFPDCSQQFLKRFNKCIEVGGDYFE